MEGPVVRIDVLKRAFRQLIRLISLALLPAVMAVASADTTLPQLSLINVSNPILENNLQTLTVGVTDDVGVASVSVNIGGVTYPMTATGRPYQYSYSFRPSVSGIVTYSVVARDPSSNIATLNGTFHVHVGQVDVCAWKGCKIGAASWSIDDGHTECRAKVEAAGFRGTFYYTAKLNRGAVTQSWFAPYTAAGHEIAAHTINHQCDAPCCSPNCTQQTLEACSYSASEVDAYRQSEWEPNIEGIESSTGRPVLTGAWPCGCADPRRKGSASPYFLGVRGYADGVANLTWVEDVNHSNPSDLYNLASSSSGLPGHPFNPAIIDRAVSEGKWAIIVSHGDCTGIDYMAQNQDSLWAAPVGEVIKYIKVRDAANVTHYKRNPQDITFDIAHNLGVFHRVKLNGTEFLPVVFDNPVTLKIHLQQNDVVLSVAVDNTPIKGYSIQSFGGKRYLLLDAALNTSRHVLVNLKRPT